MRQAAGRYFADVVIGVSVDAAVGQGHAAADAVERVENLGREHHVPTTVLGTVGGDRIEIGSFISEPLDAVRGLWEGALDPSQFGI